MTYLEEIQEHVAYWQDRVHSQIGDIAYCKEQLAYWEQRAKDVAKQGS